MRKSGIPKIFLKVARTEIESIVAGMNIPSGIAVEVVHEENQLKDFYYLIGIAFLLDLYDPCCCF